MHNVDIISALLKIGSKLEQQKKTLTGNDISLDTILQLVSTTTSENHLLGRYVLHNLEEPIVNIKRPLYNIFF